MNRVVMGIVAFLSLGLSLNEARAQSDKSMYSILRQTPRAQMRELSTDRPDKTESPYTVDAGHFQIETDLVVSPRDKVKENGVETNSESYDVMVSNLKLGLTNSMDLQVVLTPYHFESSRTVGGENVNSSNFGDTVVRLKYNLEGNDGGDLAFGLMPFVKLPTHSGSAGNRSVEGGLIVPFSISLPADWGLGFMAQINRSRSDEGDGFQTDMIASVTTGHDLFDDVAGYVELYGEQSDLSGSEFIGTFDLGFTYGFSPNIQFDIGANIGITDAADDFSPFIGFSARY